MDDESDCYLTETEIRGGIIPLIKVIKKMDPYEIDPYLASDIALLMWDSLGEPLEYGKLPVQPENVSYKPYKTHGTIRHWYETDDKKTLNGINLNVNSALTGGVKGILGGDLIMPWSVGTLSRTEDKGCWRLSTRVKLPTK